MAERPASSTPRMAARYTAVLPEPVTPCNNMPENLHALTPSRTRASADCCARFKSKSKRDGRGLECETVKSAGCSSISTSPRLTSDPRVVRGTSSDCNAAVGTLPPAALQSLEVPRTTATPLSELCRRKQPAYLQSRVGCRSACL